MNIAAITFVYNETVNLPIWLRYYGRNFGSENLYVIDRESNDGSTSNLGLSTRIRLPHDAFDEYKKTNFVSYLHHALLQNYDAVIYTDCDEILVPNLGLYSDLRDYIEKNDFDYVTAVGMNVLHMIDREDPLRLDQPILQQRKFAKFWSVLCKTLISRVPIVWRPGFHGLNRRPKVDTNLFLFHTKAMDYSISLGRQRINRATEWSERSLAANFGEHHRHDTVRFVRENFFDPVNVLNLGQISLFDFAEQLAQFEAAIVEREGFFELPTDIVRYVEIPDHLRSAF